MPVLSKPPQSYPDGLEWKGSSKMLRVCASKIHTTADRKPLYEDLPFLIGSQTYILDGLAPATLMSSSFVFNYPPLKYMVPQFLTYFKQRNQIDSDAFCPIIINFIIISMKLLNQALLSRKMGRISPSLIVHHLLS